MGTPAAKKVKASKAGNTGRSLPERDAFKPRITPLPDPRLSRSLEYGVAILERFTGGRETLGIAEMADMVGVSLPTAHRYALTLVALGRLEQDDKRKYLLAPSAADPGMAVIREMRLESPGPTILEDLREETGHTVSMGLLDGSTAVYMYRLFAHGAGQYEADGNLGVGARVPTHSTAIGRALLASLPEAELDKLLGEMRLKPSATNTVRTKGLLARVIDQARHDGIAFSDEEHAKGARSLAVPITARSGKRRLAVEVTAPADAYTMQEFLARCGPPLKHAAKRAGV